MPVTHRRHLLTRGLAGVATGLLAALPGAASAQRAGRPFTIVVLGDSLTAGYGLSRAQAFPARLQARLLAAGHQVRIVNAGLSGDTTAGGLARFDFAVPRGADAVLIALGGNDMLQGMSPQAAKANIDAMIVAAKAKRVRVALLGMRAPSNWGAAYARAFDGLYPALARKHGVPLDPFMLEGVALDPRLNQSDGIHPNAAGADRMAARLTPFVARAFGLRAASVPQKKAVR
jgi:acyl-CoA thioesterase-1